MSKKKETRITCDFTRHPGSVFVSPTVLPPSAKAAMETPGWGGVIQAIIADTPPTPASEPRQRVLPQNTPQECVTGDPRKDFVAGAAENMRIYRISHLGDKDKQIYEASPSENEDVIFNRAQLFANRSGYLVRIVRQNPHLIESFKPAIWREATDAPPVADPDAPPSTRLDGLGWYAIAKGCMFFDDRRRKNGQFKRRQRGNAIAWLNEVKVDGFYLNIVQNDLLCLLKPIPRAVTDLGDAIDWVSYHSEWRDTDVPNRESWDDNQAAFEWDAVQRQKFGRRGRRC